MISFPNAKINIGLNITEKRADGFHNIETVFHPIPIYDILEFVENKTTKIKFLASGIDIDSPIEKNLVVKAYNLLNNEFNLPGIDIHLHKNIPFGAGLGGGSSDASFMLKMLNTYFNLNISEEKLLNYASEIGSDCAFFIKNKPVYASEKGNVFTNIKLDLSNFYIYLIKPKAGINTAKAYSNAKITKPKISLLHSIQKTLNFWKNEIKNDFEPYAFTENPEIRYLKQKFYNNNAIYASMSGSGSSVFGIFSEKPNKIDNSENYFSFIGKL